jgi:hypothetical protein
MLSSGANVIILDKMLSSGANVIMVASGANVIIWCYHVMLSSGMITQPFFIFPENFTHSTETPIFLFWEYLFRNFGNLSLQCVIEEDSIGWNGADGGIRRKNGRLWERGRRGEEGGDRKK